MTMGGGSMASFRAAGEPPEYEYPDPPTARQRANARDRCWRCGAFVSMERSRAYWSWADGLPDNDGPDCPTGRGCGRSEEAGS